MHKTKDSGYAIKTDEEMEGVDPQVADAAYKEMFRSILVEELKKEGFLRYKTVSLVRLSPLHNLEVISLQKEAYGSKTFTVNVAVLPLYAKYSYLVYLFGERIGYFEYGWDYWWDFQNREIARSSFQEVTNLIRKRVLPWFDSLNTYKKMLRLAKRRNRYNNLDRDLRYQYACYIAIAMGNEKLAKRYYRKCIRVCKKYGDPSSCEIIDELSFMTSLSKENMEDFIRCQITDSANALKLPAKLFQ